MNKYYNLSKGAQWLIAIGMLLLTVVIVIIWLEISERSVFGYGLFFIVVPMVQFLTTPFFTLIGMYKYLTPMLLVYNPSQTKYDIHNGTSFDYLLVMSTTKPGVTWRTKMLGYYLEGLLLIVAKIEKKELPNSIEVSGSSYFFSERTAKRIGFELNRTGVFERVNLIANALDLIWMYSLAHGKFMVPNLFAVQTAKISGERLVEQKERLENLYRFLKKNHVND
jgi:hypothetical protein